MINRIKIKSFNNNAFNEKYKIFLIKKTDDTSIIKEKEPLIYSTYYEDSKTFYVLTPIDKTKNDLYNMYPDFHYIVKEVNCIEIPDYVLLNLLINKLPNKELKFNNLTATLYEIFDNKKEQRITLCYSITKELILSCHVKTFTFAKDVNIKKMTGKTQKAINEGKLSAYKEEGNYIVRGQDKGTYLINRSFANPRKNMVEYFSISEFDNKAYMMTDLLNSINIENHQFIEVCFDDVDYKRVLEEKRTQNQTFEDIIDCLPKETKLNVVDYCDCKEKLTKVLDKLQANYEFNEKLDENKLNLCVVKSKDSYKENNEQDRYIKSANIPIQNIEDKSINETSIKQCLLELVIKYEAILNSILTTDLQGKWAFYAYINKTPHVLKIEDNKIIQMTSLEIPDNVLALMEERKDKKPKIIFKDDKYLIITDTEIRLLPDYNQFTKKRNEYVIEKEDKRINKARSQRNKLFGEIIDVNTFKFQNAKYLSIGEIGYGMNTSIENSPSTRRIEENGLEIEDIAYLFSPNICQLNKYAITPHPYKVMNEMFIINGGIIDSE
jgi:hypothetical protein